MGVGDGASVVGLKLNVDPDAKKYKRINNEACINTIPSRHRSVDGCFPSFCSN